MTRSLEPEWLDQLPGHDPQAQQSRLDLQRVNAWMRHRQLLARSILKRWIGLPPRRLADLGTGDGTFMLRLAKELAPHWPPLDLYLLDQQMLVAPNTRAGFEQLGWTVHLVQQNVLDWIRTPLNSPPDLIIANLFLHHFEHSQLKTLLAALAHRTRAFFACDPRRYRFAFVAAALLWLIRCNSVTRHDAVVSVRAGFRDQELSQLWPQLSQWNIAEFAAGFFTHAFAAVRIP